jgi:predicted ArsR family transcriptional regulator
MKYIAERADTRNNNFQYPNHPGYKAEGTSREAADNIAPAASGLRGAVLRELAANPNGLTPDELARRFDKSFLSIRPRFSELLEKGLIVEAGARRKNESGHTANVYRLASARQDVQAKEAGTVAP